MTELTLMDLVILKAAAEIVLRWLPKSRLDAKSVKQLEKALSRVKKLIQESK